MSNTVGKVITCKAAVAWELHKPLVIEQVQVAPPKEHEVRIRIVSTGVCHTDASAIAGIYKDTTFPTILGHEGAGIVESVGKGVSDFKAGDHVIPLYIPECKECSACKSNRTNLCLNNRVTQSRGVMPDGTTRFTCKGQKLHHFMGTSTFAEYTVVAEASLCKINKDAPLEKVCLLGCAIPTGYGAALNTANVLPGSTCAIWGLGGVGLAIAMGCKNAGASKIFGIDINSDKFEVGKKFGITDFVNPNEVADKGPLQNYLKDLTNGGFDYTFEAIGNVQTMRTAFESTREGWGTAVVVGLTDKEVTAHPMHFLLGRTWKGSAFGGWKGVSELPKLVEEYLNGKLLIDEFITHTMCLNKINEAFDLMREGKSLRSVIVN